MCVSTLVRDRWLNAVFGLVDPLDVRWIFLSHDDRDHAGNPLAMLDACPNARLLTTWFAIGRMAEECATPLDRCRFVNDGDHVDIGDRGVRAVRPPLFDNPTTRGLFDTSTDVLWSVETFATNTRTACASPTSWGPTSSATDSSSASASSPPGTSGSTR